MNMRSIIFGLAAGAMLIGNAMASYKNGEVLIKMKSGFSSVDFLNSQKSLVRNAKNIADSQWLKVSVNGDVKAAIAQLSKAGADSIEHIQPNFLLSIPERNLMGLSRNARAMLINNLSRHLTAPDAEENSEDNPDFKFPISRGKSFDPLNYQSWGLSSIGAIGTWPTFMGSRRLVVAVIDTGIDYNHIDLADNLWRNPGESGAWEPADGKRMANVSVDCHDKSCNGLDDDNNGYVDDVIGWDFSSNDNRPFDLKASLLDMLTKGGNPGHGTFCAGEIGAVGYNSVGLSGVAPRISIMGLRFISTEGQGTTEAAISAINYAVKNGAKVLSNSWGSAGAGEASENDALKEAITNAMDKGVLFIAASGNGDENGVGYDNDTDEKAVYPASFNLENIVSVAANGSDLRLTKFSNFGKGSVHLSAPGKKILSTVVGGGYEDTIIKIMGVEATWDGTSMATPYVAGAAALYWSKNPSLKFSDVKNRLLSTVTVIPALDDKLSTSGILNVQKLMGQ